MKFLRVLSNFCQPWLVFPLKCWVCAGSQQFLAVFPLKWCIFVQGAQVNVPRLRKVPTAGVRGAVAALGEVSRERGQ